MFQDGGRRGTSGDMSATAAATITNVESDFIGSSLYLFLASISGDIMRSDPWAHHYNRESHNESLELQAKLKYGSSCRAAARVRDRELVQ